MRELFGTSCNGGEYETCWGPHWIERSDTASGDDSEEICGGEVSVGVMGRDGGMGRGAFETDWKPAREGLSRLCDPVNRRDGSPCAAFPNPCCANSAEIGKFAESEEIAETIF